MWWCVVPRMVGRGVVACGPPDGGACSGGVWHLSWWGLPRCCVAPLMVGRVVVVCGLPHGGIVLRCNVWCCVALRRVVMYCVALCRVSWWCVASLMVGRAALVCGPPHAGACCVGVRCVVLCGVVCFGGVWPPAWWGVLRWCGPPSQWWGVLWWCVAPLMVGCALLACVGRFFLVVVLLLFGRGGRAGLPSACGAPPLCPDRDGRAGLQSVCGAPPRVVVLRVSSPCCSFSLVPLSCMCAVVGRVLAGTLFYPPTPPRGRAWRLSSSRRCSSFLSVLAGFHCWPPARGCCRRSCPPPSPPPRASSGFVVACLLLLVFACSRSVLPLLSPGSSGSLPPPRPSWFVLRGCSCPSAPLSLSACCLFAAALRLVCQRASALALARPSPPGLCFAGVASLPFVLALPALFCPSVCRLFAIDAAPPPPTCACFCFAGVVALVAWRFCVLFRAVRGALYPAVLRHVLLSFVCGLVPPCAAFGCHVLRGFLSVQCGAAASGVAPCVLLCHAAVFSAVRFGLVSCCTPCCLRCVSLCGPGLFFCVLCCAASLGAVLRCAALCWAALRLVVPCLAVLLRTVLSAGCRVALSHSLLWGALGCCVLCCMLCCAALCCCVLCC